MSGLHLRFRIGAAGPSVDLDLPRHGITALFGPSGSGKTTCLRVIAGLENIPGARVALGDEVWQDGARFVPVHRRALGYVFQEASLFSHLTVRANLAFGYRRVAPHERRFAPAPVAALLGIETLLERHPDTLSGGERQRVAIARALLASPRLLLMDEPLAALDVARKQEILPYLERLRDELSMPILYVSHAPDEVTRLADHLVLLDGGRVMASGPLESTMAQAGLPGHGAGVVFDTAVAAQEEDGLCCLEFAGGLLRVEGRTEARGSRLRCRIQARDVSLALARPAGTTSLNIFAAQVTGLVDDAERGQVLLRLRVGAAELQALVPVRSVRELGLGPGRQVWAQVNAMTLLPGRRPLAPAEAVVPALAPERPDRRSLTGFLHGWRRPAPAAAT